MRFIRRSRFPLAAAAAIAVTAPAVHADLYSSNGVAGVLAGTALATLANCTGTETAIAGGVDSDGLNVVALEELIPLLPGGFPLSTDAGSYVAQGGFAWTAVNGGPADHVVTSSAICASFAATTVNGDPLLFPSNDAGADRVLCPAGSFAAGGGIDANRDDTLTSSTGPVLDDGSADGQRLTAAADGPGPAPIGWRASVYFTGLSIVEPAARVAVVCVPGSAITQIASITVAPATHDSTRALCPSGMIAYGGGVDVDGLRLVTVMASAPIFDDGTADGQRLNARPFGPDAAPIGWFGSVRNDDVSDHLLKVAAICPEPLADELTLAALSALFVTRRARRS